MSLPSTSVIIASRNRPDMLYGTVQSILRGNEVPTEIIIIDQSDQPNTLLSELAASGGCEICYHWSQSIGTSKARNLALQMARYEHLVILDDDMFVANDWLANLIKGLGNGGTKSAASGKVLPAETSDGRFTPSTRMDDEPAIYEGRVWRDVLWSNNMAIPRSVIRDVGFFDERLGPGTPFHDGDDNDYGFRLLEAGYRILYLPSAVVYHRAWRSEKDFPRLRWQYGLGRGGFYAKYFNQPDRYGFQRMMRDIRDHILSFLYHFHKQRLKAYGDLVLTWGLIVGAYRWLVQYKWSGNE